MIKVLKAGFYSTIQDQGRFGQREYGVPVSGAMDSYSSEFANKLLGNEAAAAVLEMTMTGVELQFYKSTTIAVTGAEMSPKLNGKPVKMFKSVKVSPNDILSFGGFVSGFRAYLAVKGGFLTKPVLGSRSMAKGITPAVVIQKNDELEIKDFSNRLNTKHVNLVFNTLYAEDDTLEVFKGPEFDKLTKKQQEILFSKEFEVSKHNNRMAYQLLPLFQNNLDSILTAPVLPGTVQLTPSGQLIILMRDCQTTGGYPRVLQLTEKAINKLSQNKAGSYLKMKLSEF